MSLFSRFNIKAQNEAAKDLAAYAMISMVASRIETLDLGTKCNIQHLFMEVAGMLINDMEMTGGGIRARAAISRYDEVMNGLIRSLELKLSVEPETGILLEELYRLEEMLRFHLIGLHSKGYLPNMSQEMLMNYMNGFQN